MKKIRLLLLLSSAAFVSNFSTAFADSDGPESLTISKAGDTTAKITMESKTYTAKITFADGASWDSVKDSYTVSDEFSENIEHGKVAVTIAADGTASFRVVKAAKK